MLFGLWISTDENSDQEKKNKGKRCKIHANLFVSVLCYYNQVDSGMEKRSILESCIFASLISVNPSSLKTMNKSVKSLCNSMSGFCISCAFLFRSSLGATQRGHNDQQYRLTSLSSTSWSVPKRRTLKNNKRRNVWFWRKSHISQALSALGQ